MDLDANDIINSEEKLFVFSESLSAPFVQSEFEMLFTSYSRLHNRMDDHLCAFRAASDLTERVERETRLSCLKKCFVKAKKLLTWARATAARRIVAETTCFLGTVASSYRITNLRDTYAEDFPRMLLAILDEAGATAETYTPLILSLGVQNLMLLGDTKQLRPLVKGVEHGDPYEVTRSLMERCVNAGVDQSMLTEQYRMPSEV